MKDERIIHIRNLRVFANHGVYEEETKNGQNFYINADLTLDADCGMKDGLFEDDLDQTVNYAAVCSFINEYMIENTCLLLETIAEELCAELLIRYSLVKAVRLEIRKPEAPIGLPFESVSVERSLSWHTAYLSIGSNMGDKGQFIEEGLRALADRFHTRVSAVSSMLVTKPYGPVEQDDFLNCAACIETMLSPNKLLDFLHEIEQNAGRERLIHWGPRTLDMDIVYYDDCVISQNDLTIPHVDMENREFVLKPLSEIAPGMRHPILGRTTLQLLKDLEDK